MDKYENIKKILLENKPVLATTINNIYNFFKNFYIECNINDYVINFKHILNIAFDIYQNANKLQLYNKLYNDIPQIENLFKTNSELQYLLQGYKISKENLSIDFSDIFICMSSEDDDNISRITQIKKAIISHSEKKIRENHINFIFIKTFHKMFIYFNDLSNINQELSLLLNNSIKHYQNTLLATQNTFDIYNSFYQSNNYSYYDYQSFLVLYTINNFF